MIRSSAADPETLDEIVALLISRFQPERIYLFGSRARGDAHRDSDYDLLIEVESLPEGLLLTRQGMMWLTEFPGIEVQVHVRKPGALEQRKDDLWRVDWDVVREGRQIYSRDGLPPVVPGRHPGVVREVPPSPPAVLAEWVRLAEQDLKLAELLSADVGKWKESICFHCQQSAEKFLKSLIVRRGARPLHLHDLRTLLQVARGPGVDLNGIDSCCWPLSRYAVEARYPDDDEIGFPAMVPISEDDARVALEGAQRIAAAVRPHLA